MITGVEYARQAQSSKYDSLSYDDADCQKFVELVLIDCGVKKPDGKPYDWKGSNSMWRNALAWKGTIEECYARYGNIPLGAWVFIVKYDGGEVERGYHDSEGNAKHVGIYVSQTDPERAVRDSTETRTRDGVGYRRLDGFNMIGIPKMINYDTEVNENKSNIPTIPEALAALEILTRFMKGV